MSYVVIEGLIGAGKSSLSKQMASKLGWKLMPEPVEENPFLKPFYEDTKRWAFAMQAYMLQHRYRQQIVAAHSEETCILDRSLPGDRVFAKLHLRYGNMHPLEWELYESWYATMTAVRSPFLMVYLEVDPETALERIQMRGRDVEKDITLQYLTDLDEEYETLINEIEEGKKPWTRGIQVLRIPWNYNYGHVNGEVQLGAIDDVIQQVKHYAR